ncbi:unnamed protein product [Ilex paraguariensis]|uniref:Uncharacterized protein n=1 Tax=Ilex paraguariensis TaxID=185542 RepID=A0ABC8RSC6_9AQUA
MKSLNAGRRNWWSRSWSQMERIPSQKEKNPVLELAEGEKETLIKKKGKQVLTVEKEGRNILSLGNGFRKHSDINGVQKETTINLETADPSGKDEQNSKTTDSSAEYASPNKVNDDADNEKGLVDVTVNEQCISDTFLLDHHFERQERGDIVVDDVMGLICNKELSDKGFYSGNDIDYCIEVDSQHSDSGIRVNEQVEEVQSIPHMGMTTRPRSSKLSQSNSLND